MSTDHITSCLTMTFLLRTLRDWFVTLEAIALQNPALFNTTKAYKNSNKSNIFFTCPFFTAYRWKITQNILPVERGLRNRRQSNSTNNRHKGTNHPRCRPLSENETRDYYWKNNLRIH